ncbi:MAG: RagB/SusD family nutrient uptake outer membrane protein [Bacteroidales bacterium]|nr:RagB/SusD family nutrient uptake outer membrane protein [Bacteroidales bacterium]
MKLNKILSPIIIALCGLAASSCYDLDRNPLSEGSSENWFTTEDEFEASLKNMYQSGMWTADNESWTDDFVQRQILSSFANATITGQTQEVVDYWENKYKGIGRANVVLMNLQRGLDSGIPQRLIDRFAAEAYFLRAAFYSMLIEKFGDVVYVDDMVSIEEALTMERTPKSTLIPLVYEDYDKAIAGLPEATDYQASRATKGAAMAMKARFALRMGDWKTAAEASKACMDLGVYELESSFEKLFLQTTKVSKEYILALPRSVELGYYYPAWEILSRLGSGNAWWCPSWDLLASYTCTDGKPIDESPLYDKNDPFKNRDPRCSMTIVPFGSMHCGYEYNPSPTVKEVRDRTGKMVSNKDSRGVFQYASFNGLLWKKGVDESWTENGRKSEPSQIIIRYADVLLMYAEAKIELNEIDESVLKAINQVRSRAYSTTYENTSSYPAVTSHERLELRKILRNERRMEFANEGIRYSDIIRWKIASKVMSKKNYGMLYPSQLVIERLIDKGLPWFWPMTPEIDEEGIPDFSAMEKKGYIQVLSSKKWDDRQYLWPIPSKEILINNKLTQNTGY